MESPQQIGKTESEGEAPRGTILSFSAHQAEGRAPIEETDTTVSFLGVTLEKRLGGPHVPPRERFSSDVLTEYDYLLMQKFAVALDLNQPVLVESGTGLGKTTTADRMCSLLNWNTYYANCHKIDAKALIGGITVREDTKSGFGWKDGIVMQWVRNGGVLILDEYNYMPGETRGRLHEIFDHFLSGKDEMVLIENDGERVRFHPDCRLVSLQNPPGGEYSDREILDPAQMTRFVYLKEPTEIPHAVKEARLLGEFGLAPIVKFDESAFLSSLQATDRSVLSSIPVMRELCKQFLEFETAVEELVRKDRIGADQPQRVFFSFERDLKRLLKFVEHYYNGDIYDTMRTALRYYYKNRFESDLDKQKVEELVLLFTPKPIPDPERLGIVHKLRIGLPGVDCEGADDDASEAA